ncbi:MAG TPA: hypothetical protein VFK09_13375 [Gemmatimonadales bacterium]|jgi:hypothetical protein|nr:hypothetical protein [Gemmatimonadales bacterium]
MRAGLFAAVGLTAACYTYQSVPSPAAEPGARVVARLSHEGTADLAPTVGPGVRYVEGVVVRADSAALELAVSRTEDDRHLGTDWTGERVELPRAALADVRTRRISAPATGLLGGLLAGGVVAAVELIGGEGSAAGNPPGSGPAPGSQ